MTDLQWTDEPPSEAGWYCIRKRGDDTMEQVVWVRPGPPDIPASDTESELAVQSMGNPITRPPSKMPIYQWAGPIPEPNN